MMKFKGKAFKFADNINTDYIISSRRKKDTLDTDILKQYIMEDIRPSFYDELEDMSILVAGENFGCGSAMEVAAQVVKANNINVILAKSFARSYYRNAINNGIFVIEIDTDNIDESDILSIEIKKDIIAVENITKGFKVDCPNFTDIIKDIIFSGGIVEYIQNNVLGGSKNE